MTQVIEEPYKWREQKERAIVSIEMPFNNIIDLIKAGRSADDFSNKRGINKGVIIWNDHFGIKDESNIPPCTKCWFIVATEFEEQKIYDYKKFLMNNYSSVLAVCIYPGQKGFGCLIDADEYINNLYDHGLDELYDFYDSVSGFAYDSAIHDRNEIGFLSMGYRPRLPINPAIEKAKIISDKKMEKFDLYISKILECIQMLISEEKLVLQKNVAAELKLSVRTVGGFWFHFKKHVTVHNEKFKCKK